MCVIIMFAKIVILFLISKTTAQFNGEFWWLNDKLTKDAAIPPPKFEVLSEFDTDESAKIVFRDKDLIFENNKKTENSNSKARSRDWNKKLKIDFQDQSEIVWPSDCENKKMCSQHSDIKEEVNPIQNITSNNYRNKNQISDDLFEFIFPENDNIVWRHETINVNKNQTQNTTDKNENIKGIKKVISLTDRIPLNMQEGQVPESESICTFLKKSECYRRGGIAYLRKRNSKKLSVISQRICCILPIAAEDPEKIHFIDNPVKINKRNKRSNKEEKISQALRQRNALLQRKYGSQYHNTKPTSPLQTKITQKVVTPDDDYVDPYWNIKNPNSQNKPNQPSNSKYHYGTEDYVEDYVEELPKPGLVGLYSDNNGRPTSWSFVNENPHSPYGDADDVDSHEGDNHPSFGYGATVDPRLEDRLSVVTKTPIIRRPAKLTTQTSSDEYTYNSESQTINYQSNPDFQVLKGFKLLNLMRNKSKIYKNEKKTMTMDNDEEKDREETVLIGGSFVENEYDDVFDTNQQVYKECGKVTTKEVNDHGKNIGDTEAGSHPWLAMLVLTRKQQTILCYATLVTSRAAVTAADCVHGRNCPGEVTLVAGAWDLNDESSEGWQKRMVSAYLHTKYKPGDLANNLAVLHWKRPLRLNANVQPACLTDPHVGDDCRFYGWGGYDQAIRHHSRWQRASILTPRACAERLPSKREPLPADAFCASVPSRGTVAGVGAPLICTIGGRRAAAGVAIWRDSVVVLAPAHEWTMQALNQLLLQ